VKKWFFILCRNFANAACYELKTAAGRRVLIAFSSERTSQRPNKPFERMPEKRAPLNSVDDITEKKRT
jgi:hypothetical protein